MTHHLLRMKIADIRAKAAQRPNGYFEEILSLAQTSNETHVWITREDYGLMAAKYSTEPRVGTELKKLVSWFVWAASANDCEICKTREDVMNDWGPIGCAQRIDRIKRWLKHSAATHNIAYSTAIAEALINKAIRNAKAKANHGE